MSNNKFLYETHMHTFESSWCSLTFAKTHVKYYKERGYAGIIITDHLSTKHFHPSRIKPFKPLLLTWEEKVNYLMRGYEKAKAEGDKIGLDVFFGWEFYANGSEFLTYGLGKDFLLAHKDLDKMPIEEYSRLVRENGGFLAHAHPYRSKGSRSVPVDHKLVDAVEIYNASRTHKLGGKENAKAIVFARELGLPVQAGTDAHLPGLKLYSGVRLKEKAESIFDIINAIKEQTAEPILQDKEENLFYGDIEIARKEAEADNVSDLLVKVFYDCKHAKEHAEALCDYIQDLTAFDTICDHMDNFGHNEKNGKLTKTIVIGHHDETNVMMNSLPELKHCKFGTKYGFKEDLCVLTASQSELKESKEDYNRFSAEFFNRFDEPLEDVHLRNAQFRYSIMELMEKDLNNFLNN